jgi:hypothetical protein
MMLDVMVDMCVNAMVMNEKVNLCEYQDQQEKQ